MSVKVKLSPNASIAWPSQCVQCGCPSDREDTVYKARYRGTGYYLAFFTYSQKLFKISYPVCFRHKLFAKLCRFVFWVLLVPVFVLGLSLLFLYFGDGIFDTKIAVYFFIGLTIFILSIKLQPLRIIEASDNRITLLFKNKKSAIDFLSINRLSL